MYYRKIDNFPKGATVDTSNLKIGELIQMEILPYIMGYSSTKFYFNDHFGYFKDNNYLDIFYHIQTQAQVIFFFIGPN